MLHRALPRAESCPGSFPASSAGFCEVAPVFCWWWGVEGILTFCLSLSPQMSPQGHPCEMPTLWGGC